MHKTNVSTETSKADRAVEDPNKHCPIHHKPHPLRVPEDNAICFCCCASTVHQAKNCDVVVKCTECDSEMCEFFEMFGIQGTTSPYTLKTCAGTKEAAGRREYGYNVVSVDGKVSIPLPMLVECNDVPNNREEIPTPEVPLHQRHLMSIADKIPPVDPNAEILLLLG